MESTFQEPKNAVNPPTNRDPLEPPHCKTLSGSECTDRPAPYKPRKRGTMKGRQANVMSYDDPMRGRRVIWMPKGTLNCACWLFMDKNWDELAKFEHWTDAPHQQWKDEDYEDDLPYNEKEEEEKRRKFEAEMRRKYHRPAIGKLYKPAHWKLDRKKTTHAVGLAIILLVLLLLWFGPSEVFQDVVDFEGKFAMILLKWKR